MSILTAALYQLLASDITLTGMISTYKEQPAIFTIDTIPGDAKLPYIVTAGEVAQIPFDTKNSRGRDLLRDVRCYAAESGSVILVEQIAERVRELLHRQEITLLGWSWLLSEITGPIAADESDTYGRILSLRFVSSEN